MPKQDVDARVRGHDDGEESSDYVNSIQVSATAFFPCHRLRLLDCALARNLLRACRINQYGPPRTSDLFEYLPWVYSFETNSN